MTTSDGHIAYAPRFRWPLRLSPDASLAEVVAFLNAVDLCFIGTPEEFAVKPDALRRWAGKPEHMV